MGARGNLKIAPHLRSVDVADTAAADVPALAPRKPPAVRKNRALSRLWDEIVPELDRAGLVSVSDGPAIELALRHFLIARVSSEQIGSNIVVPDTAHGSDSVKKNPAEAVFRAESAMFLRYAAQLGMTFVARARTPSGKDGDGEQNPFTPPSEAVS